MITVAQEPPQIDQMIELRGVYDGYSIVVYTDGTIRNRWANDTGDGPEPGYERRWQAAEDAIVLMVDPPEKCETPTFAEVNARIFKHEAETPMRDHDEDGTCCRLARLIPTGAPGV